MVNDSWVLLWVSALGIAEHNWWTVVNARIVFGEREEKLFIG
jgi:hypothetical protein